MWPGRRYWIWAFGVWLVLTAGLLAYIAWGPFFTGPLYYTGLYAWFVFWTPLFAIVGLAMGLALKALRRSTGAESWVALCVLLSALSDLAGFSCAWVAYDWWRRIAAGTAGVPGRGIDPRLTPGVSTVAAIVFLALGALFLWLAVRARRRGDWYSTANA